MKIKCEILSCQDQALSKSALIFIQKQAKQLMLVEACSHTPGLNTYIFDIHSTNYQQPKCTEIHTHFTGTVDICHHIWKILDVTHNQFDDGRWISTTLSGPMYIFNKRISIVTFSHLSTKLLYPMQSDMCASECFSTFQAISL